MRLQNKTIIVTGANGGMGLETVKTLLQEGANIIACDINTNQLVMLENSKLTIYDGNLLDETHVQNIFSKTTEQYPKIDGLVNTAGIAQRATPIDDVSLDEWNKTMEINMTMLFLTCREAAKYMKKQQSGSIVTIASISAVRPRPGLQTYVASKGGAESFSRALAIELAENNVRVNTIHPGPCDTNMLQQFTAKEADSEVTKEEVFRKSVPLGKLLTPSDIAQSILFLLTEEASMITGAALNVDGGRGI
ncbi:SDR family NAD(P)-dependent oxidoreductase [Virgibacillus necropolis]|uniref:3-ketoacyl-ACP reductase n=1 Tax=Virgibacillus necropolis TaxID=163877 RepID=A0A221MI38_9BACI|nr:SDR family oxidoreductase [Virgibacillus necropolis]ASN07305.1 3-ketoacyl-ACP reductase [Virgibacillus necropolis]